MRPTFPLVWLVLAVPGLVAAQEPDPEPEPLDVPTFAEVDLDDAFMVTDAARPAYEAVRARCPSLPAAGCNGDASASSGTITGDRVELVADCGGEGNGGDFDDTETFVYDLAQCRATVAIQYRGQGESPFVSTFDVFALTEEPALPPPSPPGTAFAPDDATFAGTRLALTTSCTAEPITEALGLRISAPLVPTHEAIAGRPSAEDAAHLSATELRAIGVPPRERPIGPGRLLRAYRLTAGMPAGDVVLRSGDYEVVASECISVVHVPTGTFRRVLCSRCTGSSEGPFRWIEAAGPIAFAVVEHDWSANEPDAALIAIDLEGGTAHAIRLPEEDEGGSVDPSVRGDELRLGDSSDPISIAALLAAMRDIERGPTPAPVAEPAAEETPTPTTTPTPAPTPAPTSTPTRTPTPTPTSTCGCRATHRPLPVPLALLPLLVALRSRRRR